MRRSGAHAERRLPARPSADAGAERLAERVGTEAMRNNNRISPGQTRCIVIAGPNGAGKTTFARDFLPTEAGVIHFVNADLIAGGLSPLRPEDAAIAVARVSSPNWIDSRAHA